MPFTSQKALVAFSFTLSLFGAAILPALAYSPTFDTYPIGTDCPCPADPADSPNPYESPQPTPSPTPYESPSDEEKPECPCPPPSGDDRQDIPPIWDNNQPGDTD